MIGIIYQLKESRLYSCFFFCDIKGNNESVFTFDSFTKISFDLSIKLPLFRSLVTLQLITVIIVITNNAIFVINFFTLQL